MMKHYIEFMWMFTGIYMVSRAAPAPYNPAIGVICGAFILVLSIIHIVG